jgi:acetyltransferase-like isoleucine patch superfamily enzyme
MSKVSVFQKITPAKLTGFLRGSLLKLSARSCGFPVKIEHNVLFLNPGSLEIGDWVTIRWHTQIHENVKMGNRVFIGKYCDIGTNVIIEDFVTLADRVVFLSNIHNYNDPENRAGEVDVSGMTVIGKGAWIGHRAMILPQVSYIGRGAVIGAGAVVTKDVRDNTIVAGNPAKVIKVLSSSPKK